LVYLKNEVRKLGFGSNGAETSNFLYIDIGDKDTVKQVVSSLARKGVFVRGTWPKPYDKGIVVTGAPRREMSRFLSEFKKAVNK
jgi:histidinol-phosphate/aromatic aminotransferase/cobyric acid decarboxylase-like protein